MGILWRASTLEGSGNCSIHMGHRVKRMVVVTVRANANDRSNRWTFAYESNSKALWCSAPT